ncbi:unnamed protein product [Didymodactylos carnosus]|uniref:Prolyl endopeptidase n=1 Tax=Didymodactylos carnosus TaxID=1234261 RepID=A0A813SLT5_9BILA|nr:unnamed protein product [Didymodactylos carnosus]CAF0845648.1 unnamed protein product [Didymodactylos carnosus]CAF3582557.1 unnamed protein product [Didymodactylos carnosus]CAF3630915.1 unnamed protein product [Didymodactylos carnosus]
MSVTDPIHYSQIRRDDNVIDDYHSTQIHDPYRWLEDPGSVETEEFVRAQNVISQKYLKSIPYREKFCEHLKQVFNIPKFSCPSKYAGKYYYHMNTGLQNQDIFYELDSLDKSTDEAQIILDPNTFSEDGTVAIQSMSFSDDGKTICYAVSDAGSDWSTVYFLDVASRKKHADVLERTKFSSLAWTMDNKGIFYRTYQDARQNSEQEEKNEIINGVTSRKIEIERTDVQEIYYHRLGTPRGEDICVVRCEKDLSDYFFSIETSNDGLYLIASIRLGTLHENRLWYYRLGEIEKIEWIKLIDDLKYTYEFITSRENKFYLKTNMNAKNYRLIVIDIEKPTEIIELIPEHSEDLLEDVKCVNQNYFLCEYLSHVKSVLYLYDLKTGQQLKKFNLSIGNIQTWGDERENEIFIRIESFLSPSAIYVCDLNKSFSDDNLKLFKRVEFNGIDLDTMTTEQVFVKSKQDENVKIPMFLVHKKSMIKNGENPVCLYVYGGFSISIKPFFSIATTLWIHHFNGVFAVVNARGGGEYGEEWHKSGYREKKWNTFYDVCSCSEYLIEQNYTSASKLAINGGSNGGLTVSVCANLRPDLFGTVVIQVGVLDLYRYHKWTIGHYWIGEYGSSDVKEDFDGWIKNISPLHNIPKNSSIYPSIMVTTADHDDRVVPGHSFKYIAQLQHQLKDLKNNRPLIIRIDIRAGHGSGKPTVKRIEELSDIYCFIAHTLNATFID